jgi:very-short-patch-repair endonuclease
MPVIFNNKSYTARRKALRRSLSKSETIMWVHLSRQQMNGYKFRRQYSVDQYIIDFYCPKLGLAVEIDGDSHYHSTSQKYDTERQKYIESYGIHFLRFTNDDVYNNLYGVLQAIYEWTIKYKKRSTPPHVPSSLRRSVLMNSRKAGYFYYADNK